MAPNVHGAMRCSMQDEQEDGGDEGAAAGDLVSFPVAYRYLPLHSSSPEGDVEIDVLSILRHMVLKEGFGLLPADKLEFWAGPDDQPEGTIVINYVPDTCLICQQPSDGGEAGYDTL